jgi:catechol 2,3-dioxygenase-like lactoylglutathione lyase family enzyme
VSIEINGIAHVIVTVQDLQKVKRFYSALTEAFGMECLVDTEQMFYAVGGRTGLGARQGDSQIKFDQYRAGLHHLCLRARDKESVNEVAVLVAEIGGHLIHPPQLDEWAPDYYSVLFEDPCGTRLEVNYVPGKGNLDESVELPLSESVQNKLSTD